MNAIIIDDEPANIENLEGLLQKHCPQVAILATADHVSQAASLVQQLKPDLLFLDIQMGKQSGFDLLHNLPVRNFEVIFVTAYDKYGIQAVKVAALDYILKPIDINELTAAVAKAEEKIKHKKDNSQLDLLLDLVQKKENTPAKIALSQAKEIRYVLIEDIAYCQADNTYTFFFLKNKEKILVTRSLKYYADILTEYGFLRPHQSYVVNPRLIKSWLKEDGGTLLLLDGNKIPVSKPNREKIKNALSVRRF